VSTAKSPSRKSPSRIKLGVANPKPSSRGGLRVRGQEYVGIDLHRRRSVIVRMNDAGEVLDVSKAPTCQRRSPYGISPATLMSEQSRRRNNVRSERPPPTWTPAAFFAAIASAVRLR
jgi:hypothetical protein